MTKYVSASLFWIALKIWKCDFRFQQYPFGPPDHGIKYGFAMWAYSTALGVERRRERIRP